jgi:hypothetical protein
VLLLSFIINTLSKAIYFICLLELTHVFAKVEILDD